MLRSPTTLFRLLRWAPGLLRAGPRGHITAADLIERQAKRRPGASFVRFEGRELGYGAFNAAANRVAHWALARGLGRGDVVALLMGNRPEYLEVWAGLAKLGVTTALLNTNLGGESLAHVLREAECRALIVGDECSEALGAAAGLLPAGLEIHQARDPLAPETAALLAGAKRFDEQVAGMSPLNPPRAVRAELRGGDPLFYIYTSGTTGLPKAARFSHARFMAGGFYSLLAGFGARDTLYCALPLYHTVGGVMCVNAVLRAGGTLALARRFSARHFWDEVAENGATAFQYIGEICRYLLNQPPHPGERDHGLRFCVGNGMGPDVWTAFQERFGIPRVVEFYGATEANVSLVNLEGRVGSVGVPAPGNRVALVRYDLEAGEPARRADGRCIPCAPGEPGELLGRIAQGRSPAGRFEGYTSKRATEQKILRDVFQPGDAWFRSGDLLRRDPDGYFYFVDRVGDTFRWKGENVSTQEVAEALGGFAGVELAAVYGVEIPGAEGRAGMASLVFAGSSEGPEGPALYAHVAAALPAYARPAFVRQQAAPELTGTFKLRKVELAREGYDPSRVGDPLFYRDDAARCYRRLDGEAHRRIRDGSLRF